MRLQKLLAPGKIGSMKLKNRFVVPPMGTNLATYNGEVTEEMIAYYRRRAKGGFGLIIIEVTAIDRKGLLQEITGIVTGDMDLNMRAITLEAVEGIVRGIIMLYVLNLDNLNSLLKNLQKIEGIEEVRRI
jgi:2,4-dienoyl-CoA reductase-like NADH-dependent reductase (Old Yellow Enzyme family)